MQTLSQTPEYVRRQLITRLANFYMGEEPQSLLTRTVEVPKNKENFLASAAGQMLKNDTSRRQHQLAYIQALPFGDEGWPLLATLIEFELALRTRRMELGQPYYGKNGGSD